MDLVSWSFSLKIGSWYISFAVLFVIYSSFLYFFCKAAIFKTSAFFLIFAKTFSVSSWWFWFSNDLRPSVCSSSAWLICYNYPSLSAIFFSASCKDFIIFASVYLVLLMVFLSWLEVSGWFFLATYFLTLAVCFSSMSAFLLTALNISVVILSCYLIKELYLSSILWSSFFNSSI